MIRITILLCLIILAGLSPASAIPTATGNPHGEMTTDCRACHTPESWNRLRDSLSFTHDGTRFPLLGTHAQVPCGNCHQSLVFADARTTCAGCHNDPHQSGLGTACQACHTPEDWQNHRDEIEIHTQAGFAFAGAHAAADCDACHQDRELRDFTRTSADCRGCHQADYQNTTNPGHVAAGFSRDCLTCHSPDATTWRTTRYNHSAGYPLTGAHEDADCNACHTSQYAGTTSDCFACHETDYTGTDNPRHGEAGFDHQCTACHDQDTWTPATMDHDQTQFALTGAHRTATCGQCHAGGYSETSAACVTCHESDYTTAADPRHATAEFPVTCETCHGTESWKPAALDHGITDFPLTGAHRSVACNTCHTNGFTGTSSACFTCHDGNYAAAEDPDHRGGNFDHDCALCHSTTRWTPAEWDHNRTHFPLTGAHEKTACDRCHTNGFTGTATDCYTCHESDYRNVDDPDHLAAEFGTACQDCHTTSDWDTEEIDHSATRFPLTGAHKSVGCGDCHVTGYAGTRSDCSDCHMTSFTAVEDPNHNGSGFPTECELCHNTGSWRPAAFDHARSDFPLTGAHEAVRCNDCHAGGYSGTTSECFACHENDFTRVADPDHAAAGFDHDCSGCHTTTGWTPVSLDHNLTGFPLTGAHQAVECNSCHTGGFTGTNPGCVACHAQDYRDAGDPDHPGAGFPTAYRTCHTTEAWRPSHINHDYTAFPLTGAHQAADCNSCHTNGYTGTASACFACHESDYNGAGDPDHRQGNYNHDCTQCHTTMAWEGGGIDHDQTRFPLTGAHQSVACNSCHTSGYTGTARDCYACHESDYTGTSNPDHAAAGFPAGCETCHTTDAWKPSYMDHDLTGFSLTGAHLAADCNQCHRSGYTGTASDCYACHGTEYGNTLQPDHPAAGFSIRCSECHDADGWKPSGWKHAETGFTLTGAHAGGACTNCHAAGYTGTRTDCYSCHEGDYNGTTRPNHSASGFPTVCRDCHSTTAWRPSDWNHSQTAFNLTGAHLAVTCNGCHATGFAGTSTDCYACHPSDYTSAADPDHAGAGFSTQCQTCHSTDAWRPASLDHNLTGFPLTGAHLAVACNRCHISGYSGTSKDCYTCHATEYAGVADPNHVTGSFDHNCTNCHGTSAWRPSTWDHNQTRFRLTGAHTRISCASCHTNGYSGTPSTCIACHRSRYNAASNPNHATAGFPTSCLDCHTTAAWTPANWDHDGRYFPIYSGKHRKKWNDCGDCHVNPSNYSVFECINCHEHNKAKMDDKHKEENGYRYQSTACLSCHPRGKD